MNCPTQATTTKVAGTQYHNNFDTEWYWIDMFEIWTLRGRTVSNAIVGKDTDNNTRSRIFVLKDKNLYNFWYRL